MAWEESDPIPRRCPCGRGRYVIIRRSDDWGRFDESWEMQCGRCKAAYDLYVYHTDRKGITETRHGWVQKSALHELRELHTQTQKQKERFGTLLKKKYHTQWHRHFDGKKKNVIWAVLTENGNCYPSLPTFYDHVRHSELQEILDRYLDYRNAETVTRVLQLHDFELTKIVERIRETERNTENKEQHIRKHAFV